MTMSNVSELLTIVAPMKKEERNLPECISNKIKNMSIVCAMLVVFIHLGQPSIVGSYGWWFYQLTAEGVSRIAVPFFFVCSGFLLSRHFECYNWYFIEIIKRIKTLVVPYTLWSLIFFAYIWGLWKISPDNPVCWRMNQTMPLISWFMLATGLSLEKLPMLYPLWYIRFLFLLIVVSPFFLLIAKSHKRLFIGVIMFLYLMFNPGDGSPIGIHIGFPFEGVFYFCCGIMLSDNAVESFEREDGMVSNGIRLIAVSLLLIIARTVSVRMDLPMIWVFKPLFIVFGVFGVWSIMPKKKWPEKLTRLSFLVYVTHVFGLQLYSFFLGRDSDSIVILLGRLVCGLCFALCVSFFIRNVANQYLAALFGWRH